MLAALRVRDFRLLWSGRLISSLGSWLLVIAVPAQVFVLTGSVLATGLTVAAEYLPPVLLGPLSGVLADRYDRRRLMLAMDAFRAVAVLTLLFVRDRDTIWLVYLALVAESAGTVLFRPAAQAHTPAVVGTGGQLSGANALNAVTDGTVRLAGGPLGALLLAVAGFHALVWVDAASYLASAVAILLTRTSSGRAGRQRASLAAGLRALQSTPIALRLLPITTGFLLANAALSALLIPFGLRQLGGSRQLGFVLSALGVGFLLGAPLARALVDRCQPRFVLAASLAVTAGGFLLLFGSTALPQALAAAVVIGGAGSIALITPQTVLQRALPNAVLGRVSAVFFTGEGVATLVGALLGPVLAQGASLAAASVIAAASTLGTAVACLWLPAVSALVPDGAALDDRGVVS